MKTKVVMQDELISLKRVIEVTIADSDDPAENEKDVHEHDTEMLHMAGTFAMDNKGRVWKLDKGISELLIALTKDEDQTSDRDWR